MDKKYLKYFTDNIGKCVELDNTIICYVTDNSLNRYCKNKNIYSSLVLQLNGRVNEKDITYYFDNVNFEGFLNLEITSLNGKSNYIFKNCKFRRNINIFNVGSVIFEDNKYLPSNIYYNTKFSSFRISSSNTNVIKFVNDSCFVGDKYDGDMILELSSDNIEFVNTNVYGNTSMLLNSNNLELFNSRLYADEIEITADKINDNGSGEIIANDVIIENDNNNYEVIPSVFADSIIFNNVEVDANFYNIIKNDDDFKLQEARVNLLYKFREILNNSNNDIRKELIEYNNKLYNSSIKKVLKK